MSMTTDITGGLFGLPRDEEWRRRTGDDPMFSNQPLKQPKQSAARQSTQAAASGDGKTPEDVRREKAIAEAKAESLAHVKRMRATNPYDLLGTSGATAATSVAQIDAQINSITQAARDKGPRLTKDEVNLVKSTLDSLNKKRDNLTKHNLELRKHDFEQQKFLQTQAQAVQKAQLEAIPYQMQIQKEMEEKNRKLFENKVRVAAGLDEGAPLPREAQKYYQESMVDPQRAANSVTRDLAIGKMKANWIHTKSEVENVMIQKLGRYLTDQEKAELDQGSIQTILEGNQYIKSDSFRALQGIPVDGTVDMAPEHLMSHGYKQGKDQRGQAFWGKESKDPSGALTMEKLIPDQNFPTGFRQERVGAGQYMEGKTVPENIWQGQDIQGGKQVAGAGPGVFQTPKGQTLYRTYQGMDTGIRRQDVPVPGVAQIGLQDLMKPENIALANQYLKSVGAGEITAAANMPAEAKAYMVFDAINKANLAAGRKIYQMSPEDMTKAKTAFDSWSKGLATPAGAPAGAPTPPVAAPAGATPGAPQAGPGGAPVYSGKNTTPAEERAAETMRNFGQWGKGLQEQVARGEMSMGSANLMQLPGVRSLFTEHAPGRAIVREGFQDLYGGIKATAQDFGNRLVNAGGIAKGALEGAHGGVVGTLRETVPGLSRVMGSQGEYTGPGLREMLGGGGPAPQTPAGPRTIPGLGAPGAPPATPYPAGGLPGRVESPDMGQLSQRLSQSQWVTPTREDEITLGGKG